MANTSIAFLTQSRSKLPVEAESAKGGKFGVGAKPKEPEGSSLELSTINAQFSLLLSEASAESRNLGSIRDQKEPQLVDSADVLMPPTYQTDAYDLVSLDGKELPFLGIYLPQATIEEGIPELSEADVAATSAHLLSFNKESTEMPVTTGAEKSSVEEDIALWLSDPELSFVGSSTIDGSEFDNLFNTAAQASQVELVTFPANPSLAVGGNYSETERAHGSPNQITSKSDSLGAALSDLATEIEKRSAFAEAATEGADLAKSSGAQEKQSTTVLTQLFPAQKLENNRLNNTKDSRMSARIAQNINSLRQMDRKVGAMAENTSAAATNTLEAISLNSGKAGNSVDSFVNVLLNIDTSTQSSPSITPALDQ